MTTRNHMLELERAAHHEAGHAAAYHLLELGVERVTIARDFVNWTAGLTVPVIGFGTGEVALRHAVACLAGAAAVQRWKPDTKDWERGAEGDFENADMQIDAAIGAIDNVSAYATRHAAAFLHARAQAEQLIENYWPQIEAIARMLLSETTLNGERVGLIFKNFRRDKSQ